MSDIGKRLAKAAIKALKKRKGFDWWWDDLEDDIQKEILEAVAADLRAIAAAYAVKQVNESHTEGPHP